MNIEGKVVLITGASQGIGQACAKAFGRRGALLSLTSRNSEGLSHAKAYASRVLLTPGDLSQEDVRKAVVANTMQAFGRIDILINNAGVGLYSPLLSTSSHSARAMLELNFFAVLEMIQLVAPSMVSAGAGTIVNISSITGKIAMPGLTLYAASKQALCSLSDGLRRELSKQGVHVISVCPNIVRTRFLDNVLGSPPPDSLKNQRSSLSPDACAERIAAAVRKEAREVLIPSSMWVPLVLQLFFPRFIDRKLSNYYEALQSPVQEVGAASVTK